MRKNWNKHTKYLPQIKKITNIYKKTLLQATNETGLSKFNMKLCSSYCRKNQTWRNVTKELEKNLPYESSVLL